MIASIIIGVALTPLTTAAATMYLLSQIDRAHREIMPSVVIVIAGLALAAGIVLCTPRLSATALFCDASSRHGARIGGCP